MADVEERLADHCDHRRLSELEFSARPDAKRNLDSRPSKNNLAKLTPLRFLRYFSDDDARLVASRILERNVKVAI